MKYMLLIYSNLDEATHFTPEAMRETVEAWNALTAEMQAAGVLLYNDGLAPVTEAKNVTWRDGQTVIADGPFAETREQLGGYYMLDCKDMDEALAWAAKVPGTKFGTIEVRPVNVWTVARDKRNHR
jgi:hypothetical protein